MRQMGWKVCDIDQVFSCFEGLGIGVIEGIAHKS